MINCTQALKNKLVIGMAFTLLLITTMQGQITFDPQPSFFRNQREMPFVSLVTTQDFNVATYGAIKNDGIDDLVAIQATIDAAEAAASATKAVRVVFDKGTYDIMPQTGASQALFVTNDTNILFEGNDSEIRNHNPNIGFFEVRLCTNIIFQNFSFDYAVLPFTQGIVTSVNSSNNSFTLKIDDGFPLLTASYFRNAPQNYGCLKDATGKLKVGANNYYPGVGWSLISGNTFRVFTANSSYTSQVKVNDYYVHIARDNGKTIFNTVAGKNITYLNITIYASPAGSFNGQENREFNIINCKVIPKPGTGRVQSGNADIIHVTGSTFGPWVQGCHFEAYTDDAVNLKHTTRHIMEVVSPTAIKVKFRVATTDKFVIFNPRTGMPVATPKAITKVVNLGNNIFEVTFDSNHNVTVVGEHQTADKAYLLNSACESAIFRNNVFKNGRRYGILLQSSYAQVKDCTFENLSSTGIKIENGVDWSEGYIANNIEITNNKFINCGFDSDYINDPNAAAISTVVSKLKAPCTTAYTWCGTEPVQWQGFNNITITNNDFVYNKTGINIENINGGTITKNKYTHNPEDETLGFGKSPNNLINFNNSNLVLDLLGSSSFEENKIKLITNKNFFTIMNESDHSHTYNLSLFDSLGRKIYTKKLIEKISMIDISTYQSGWYIVTLENEKIKMSKKVIFGNRP